MIKEMNTCIYLQNLGNLRNEGVTITYYIHFTSLLKVQMILLVHLKIRAFTPNLDSNVYSFSCSIFCEYFYLNGVYSRTKKMKFKLSF